MVADVKVQNVNWQVFATGDFQLSENPLWDTQLNGLWWLDIPGQAVFFKRLNQPSLRYDLSEQPGSLWLSNEHIYIGARQHLWRLARATIAQTAERLQSAPFDGFNQRFNDAYSSADTTIIGSLIDDKSSATASVYHFHQQQLHELISGFTTVNGLGLLDAQTLIIADTFSRFIGSYHFDAQKQHCQLQQTLWHQPDSLARPDGLLIYKQQLYFALFEGQSIMHLDARTSDTNCQKVPVFCPTKLCLGGANNEYVFMTSAGLNRSEAERQTFPLSGQVLYAPAADFFAGF